MTLKKLLLVLTGILCIAGAALCVAMLVRSVEHLEWGRVILYSVCLAVCVEVSVLSLFRLKGQNGNNT